jgi:hypothetical protein
MLDMLMHNYLFRTMLCCSLLLMGTVGMVAPVEAANHAFVPVVVDDWYSTPINEILDVNPPGVLLNDILPKSITYTAELVDPLPEGEGTLEEPVLQNGGFVYVPPEDWTGTTFFTYRACDGDDCTAPATVTIVVEPDKGGIQVFLPLIMSP